MTYPSQQHDEQTDQEQLLNSTSVDRFKFKLYLRTTLDNHINKKSRQLKL